MTLTITRCSFPPPAHVFRKPKLDLSFGQGDPCHERKNCFEHDDEEGGTEEPGRREVPGPSARDHRLTKKEGRFR